MSKLSKLKEWFTVPEAAKHLSIVFHEDVSEADVLRLALDGRLSLSIYFAGLQPGKRTIIKPISPSEYLPDGFSVENVMFDESTDEDMLFIQADKIVYLEGVFDLPLVFGDRLEVERRFQKTIGSHATDRCGEIVVMRNGQYFELQSRYEDPCFIKLDEGEQATTDVVMRKSALENYTASVSFPDDSLLVVRTEALRALEQSLNDSTSVAAKVSDNTLVSTIAALLAAWPGGKPPSGKDLEKAASSIGISVSDDSIRKALRLAHEIAPSLKPA